MGLQSIDGHNQTMNTVGQYDDLLKGLDAEKAREGKGPTKEINNEGLALGGKSLVFTKAPDDPTAPFKADKKDDVTNTGETADATSVDWKHVEASLHQLMGEYGLTEEQCYEFLQEELNFLKDGGQGDEAAAKPKTTAAAKKFLATCDFGKTGSKGKTDASKTGSSGSQPKVGASAPQQTDQAPLEKAVSVSGNSTHAQIMFDLYALLTLMQESAQKQRNAAREIRSTQSLQIQQAINDQAEMQRFAAKLGLFCGLVSFAISLGQVFHSAIQTYRGGTQQSNLKQEFGVKPATTTFTSAQNEAQPILTAKTNLSNAQATMDAKFVNTEANPHIEQSGHDIKNACGAPGANKETIKEQIDANENLSQEQKTAAKDYVDKFFEHKTLMDNDGQAKLDAYTAAKNDLSARTELMKGDARYQSAMSKLDYAGTRAMTYNTFAKLADTLGQTLQGIKNADATAEGARIKQAEEELDQIKDIFKQYEEILQNVLSTRKSIQQAESQTIQGMFRA